MKLVERRQGNGTYVIASSEEALVQPLAASLFHEKDDLIDIFFLRKIIEPEIAQLASENATPEEISELEEILKEQETERANAENSDADGHAIFIISWPGWPKTGSWNACSFALVDLLSKTRERYLQTEERKQKSLLGHQEYPRRHSKRKWDGCPAGHAPTLGGGGRHSIQKEERREKAVIASIGKG